MRHQLITPNAHARDRDRPGQSHDTSRYYWRSRSQPETHREPSYNPDYSRSRSQEVRDYPHLMTSHPAEDNEYTQPPVPARNYALDDDDDGGFGTQTPRNRRMISSSNVPRDYVDYRSHDQHRPRSSGDEDVDYAGYSPDSSASYSRKRSALLTHFAYLALLTPFGIISQCRV